MAKAHHGSVAKEQRRLVEQELKRGELPCVVATSSLELGIDMGDVDLVLQVAPPPSVSSGLQRIGRANHHVGGSSQGIMYPRVRTELVDAAVVIEGMHTGRIETTTLEENALDVLAQQTVAAVAASDEGLAAAEWLSTVRRSACYESLTEHAFFAVIRMLAGGYNSADLAEFSPRLDFDAETGLLTARANSQRLAVTGSGTIPDRGMYAALLPESDGAKGRRRVGELDEEMVHESRVGDVIILGTKTWKITEIGHDRVIVEPAPGRTARLPFWHGEMVGRPYDMGVLRGEFLGALNTILAKEQSQETSAAKAAGVEARAQAKTEEAAAPTKTEKAIQAQAAKTSAPLKAIEARLQKAGFGLNARNNLVALGEAQRASTGLIPDNNTLVIEQCADESGSWNVILHSPFGKRVHAPWALAVSLRIRETLGFDPQAMGADDGIILQIPPSQEEMPGADFFFFASDELDALVRANVQATALFAARFRECAARALLMSPITPGKRAPLWQQRLRAGQLLEAARHEPGFPIMAEAVRECLNDAYDMPSLRKVMEGLEHGSIRLVDVQTQIPSPFAASMLFGYVGEHLYEGDLPHAESSASVLAVDPALLGEILGGADESALIDEETEHTVNAELQMLAPGRKAKGADGVANMLRRLGPLSTEDVAARLEVYEGEDAAVLAADTLAVLEDRKRAFSTDLAGQNVWASPFDAQWLHDALGVEAPAWALRGEVEKSSTSDVTADADGEEVSAGQHTRRAIDELALRFIRTHAPVSVEAFVEQFDIGREPAQEVFDTLAQAGRVQPYGTKGLWVAPEVFARLRKRALAKMQAASSPVEAAVFSSYVLDNQGIYCTADEEALFGTDGVAQVIAQFEGVFLPAALWEETVFPDRISDYAPWMLDELLDTGEVIWVGTKRSGTSAGTSYIEVAFYPTDSPFCPLVGSDADWHDDPAYLQQLIEDSAVTCDSFAFVRAGADVKKSSSAWGDSLGQQAPRRATSRRAHLRYASSRKVMKQQAAQRAVSRSGLATMLAGHWRRVEQPSVDPTLRVVALVESLLDRYGVISREVALAAQIEGGLSSLYPVLRSMVDAGELLRGEFVAGLGPAQFAPREVVEQLRALDDHQSDSWCVIPTDDPACIYGSLLPWPRSVGSRQQGSIAVFAQGRPVLVASAKLKSITSFTEDEAALDGAVEQLVAYLQALIKRKGSAASRQKLQVVEFNGEPVLDTHFCEVLAHHGFVRTPDGMRLYLLPF